MALYPPTEEGYQDTPGRCTECPTRHDHPKGSTKGAPPTEDSTQVNSVRLGGIVVSANGLPGVCEYTGNVHPEFTNEMQSKPGVRVFGTGAMRDVDEGKLDPEGFLSPLVIKAFSEYMHENRKLKDGSFRASDNWQQFFGPDHRSVCMKSLLRHVMDVWLLHRGKPAREDIKKALCGVLFNAQAYLLHVLEVDEGG